jgi:hypothetical protein
MAVAVRNLTPQFQKLRKEHKLKKNRFGYSLLKGEQSPSVDTDYREAPTSGIELHPIGNKEETWTEIVSKTKADITFIKEKLTQLQKTQQRRLLKVFDEASTTGDPEIDSLTAEITKHFRSCERKVEKLRIFEDTADLKEAVFNARRSLAAQISKLNEEVRDVQRQYMRDQSSRCGLQSESTGRTGGNGDCGRDPVCGNNANCTICH